jgi:hypothetical protein
LLQQDANFLNDHKEMFVEFFVLFYPMVLLMQLLMDHLDHAIQKQEY